MIRSRKPSRYYKFILSSRKHVTDFQEWLVDNNFDVYSKESFLRGEVVAFKGKGGRGSLFESGYANTICINALANYMRSIK